MLLILLNWLLENGKVNHSFTRMTFDWQESIEKESIGRREQGPALLLFNALGFCKLVSILLVVRTMAVPESIKHSC